MYDMMIIGAGPAGLSAAIYGVRAGKSVLVLEGKTYGGQIINTPEVENYPGIRKVSGFEFATGLYQQAKELLSHHRKALDEIAAFLIERESITGKEFMEIFHKIESDGDIPEDAAVAEENTAVAEAEIGVIGEIAKDAVKTAEDADETDLKVGIIHEYKNNRSIT